MPTLLVRNATLLVTMDRERRRIADGGLFIRDNVIEVVGRTAELPQQADRILDLRGHLVLPGMINTHHHLYQTLTRALPGAQNASLFQWLKTLYPIWAELTPEAAYTSALVGMAELMLTGCTTTSDHLYLYPNGVQLDDTIRAAAELGIRFHPTRGGMSLGESQGGLPPDRVTEREDVILTDARRVIETYHDPRPYSMCRIGVAPCSPFSVTPELMREAAALARSYGVRLHTHLAETLDEEVFCLERFGRRPVEYAAELGWVGEDVWHAHAVHVNEAEAALLGRTGTGVAHCPTSNMRLASGIAPLGMYRRAGVPVGLGVDGSASNDSSHMLAEPRQALLLQRVLGGPTALTVEEALELATIGGARVLGRDDIGSLAPGMAADFIAFDLQRLDFAGAAVHDPVGALVLCAPQRVDLAVINGSVVVEQGQLVRVELGPILERHNRLSRAMVDRAGSRL
ncbi:MAG: 8-oxoguanine deaminase [Herpetosiphonaceae bacterium]|nr:MAG: 8-oxoguanine deaminase [Herpetosiphonaceae bacterium]